MRITIETNKKVDMLGDLYGIFFEDLNHAADGGLYAEMVENRAFEYDRIDNAAYDHLTGWDVIGTKEEIGVSVVTGNPVNEKNPHYFAMDIHMPGKGAGICNAGFHQGMYLKKGAEYLFSCWAKREQDLSEPLCISLRDSAGRMFAQQEFLLTPEWKKYEFVLSAREETEQGRLVIMPQGRGKVYMDFISLFPQDTYKGRKGGVRRDLGELLEKLHPKFMRFPGGCLTHDGALDPDARDAQYRWKNTVGKIEGRPARRNNWGYNQTLGLGFFELFQLCEDIGAKPLPVISPGYDPHHHREAPISHMDYFIQEALDLIEFANGPADSRWGGLRVQMGHPKPFGLEYLGIGNEEVGEAFYERYRIVAQAVRERYPEIKLIGTGGPFAAGSEYERGWRHAREGLTDLVDEHYYQAPEWFVANHHRYDAFEAQAPYVFLGEYASKGNTWYNALCESSFMIGLEKNAKSVKLACYAPLLCSAGHVNWRPDMIWFNGRQSFGTANYYVQKLFMENQGDYTLKLTMKDFPEPECRTENSDRIIGNISLGCYHSVVEYRDIVIKNEETGEVFHFDDCRVGEDEKQVSLQFADSLNYTLELKAVEKRGLNGFRIYFGEKDERDRFCWTIGGWQNQDTIVTEVVNGADSDLSQCLMTVERNREYTLRLEVTGREIRTYIDGRPYHKIESGPVIVEPLYAVASVDCERNILIKAANLTMQSRKTEVVLEGISDKKHQLTAFVMAGWDRQEENSFEQPDKISPVIKEAEFEGSTLIWEFPAESFTVLRIH